MWNKERNVHEDWEDAGEECEEYEILNKEEEAGRVSQPGSKTRTITKGMLITVDCDAPDHAFYVAEVLQKWSMFVHFYGTKFLKPYKPSYFYDEKDGSQQPWVQSFFIQQMILLDWNFKYS